MNTINIQFTTEQVALLQKVLEPYVSLYSSITGQFTSQMQTPVKAEKLNDKEALVESQRRG